MVAFCRRAVVRNGHLPAREVLTTVGLVEVQGAKICDRCGSGVKFNSALAPPYLRRSPRAAAALPWLYHERISSGDLGGALEVLAGDGARGLSPAAVVRLKRQWSKDHRGWTRRSLKGKRYAYWWVGDIDMTLRESDGPKLSLLVTIGVTADAFKERLAISDRLRESTEPWLGVLRDLKERGPEVGPRLAVGDGALGFCKTLDQAYPQTPPECRWFHKMGNILTDLPKSLQSKAKADLQAIWMAATRTEDSNAFQRFLKRYGAKYPKATEKLAKVREALALLLRLPGRSLGTPAHHQPQRVHATPPYAISPAGPRTAIRAQPS